ncbi:hypothetical protein LXA43DRAFT_867160, partial [Ganoderma leucocontextum]
PEWVRHTFNWMDNRRSQLGTNFMSAAEWWMVVERTYGWETSSKGYGTKHCPDQVVHWLRVLRADVAKVPAIEDVGKFGQQWWSWWASIQPEWRERNSVDLPVIGGHGDWDALKRPGKNSLRIVLLSLAWW